MTEAEKGDRAAEKCSWCKAEKHYRRAEDLYPGHYEAEVQLAESSCEREKKAERYAEQAAREADEGAWCESEGLYRKAERASPEGCGKKYRKKRKVAEKRCEALPLPEEIEGKDGAVMDLVPAGAFVMGSEDGVGYDDEHPAHEVFLDSYYIDRYEVTVSRYERCVEVGGCSRDHFRTKSDNEYCNSGYADTP